MPALATRADFDPARHPAPMRVLVVDDDPIHRETARMFLSMYGRAVTLAENGTTALAIATKTDFDVLVVDLEMPDMTGLEVIASIRRMPRHADLPIIMVTSRDDAMAIDRAYELGASSFVVKPVNWTLLDQYLRFVLRASRNEIAARKAHAQVEELSRAKDNLLSVIRHEMKTPLNAIVGFTRLTSEARATGDLAAMEERLQFVCDSGERLLASFGDMAAYSDLLSHRFEFRPEPISASWVIGDVLDLRSRKALEKGVGLESHEECRAARINADQSLLASAVVRLIDNALVHARRATRIGLVLAEGPEGTARFRISDDGEGMSADEVARALAPFSQVDMSPMRKSEGLGLGLPIAAEIVRLHGGTLTLNSRPGQGTEVEITLPQI